MGKIHTHYDNLKVARGAPQEVVRAAYKALSQKYHPDKNPGDDRAARIMAIVNTAYGTLSDPQRRKEHDDWIAQEEYEIELVDSTRQDDPHRTVEVPVGGWSDGALPVRRRPRTAALRLWITAVTCLGAGWIGGVFTVTEPRQVSTVLATAWGGKPAGEVTATANAYPRTVPGAAANDGWESTPRPYSPDSDAQPPPIKVVAVSQVILPGYSGECENETPALAAPNGEPWPTQSGYVEGFPLMNRGQDMQLTLDNGDNAFPVFIKVYDLERRSNVRYVFVQSQDKFVVDGLASGRYEIRYQNIDLAGKNSCTRRQRG
ncbi:J domain-containing protein [Pseudoduganella lutea]|uniref:J domain-containing protein n=1 Tax=Pseudoduganella lutea TaxID=321985 RepID=A0A4P6KWF1_9BURK|nr:J domain-containing protein [Pseudoduganella lutea]QBE63481.1 J domain-containing protein [Pseudoduganella lutea]